MAYRKLLSTRTNDELKKLVEACEKINNQKGFARYLLPTLSYDEDMNVVFMVYVFDEEKGMITSLPGRTYEEMKSIIIAYTLGMKD